jgi:hypothetical protein
MNPTKVDLLPSVGVYPHQTRTSFDSNRCHDKSRTLE